jgi:hypothetical protein
METNFRPIIIQLTSLYLVKLFQEIVIILALPWVLFLTTRDQQMFSVKDRTIDILVFDDHMWLLSHRFTCLFFLIM